VNRDGVFEPAPGLDENATVVIDELLRHSTEKTAKTDRAEYTAYTESTEEPRR